MRSLRCLLVLSWLSAPAAADTLYKCTTPSGVAYQSMPCAAGSTTEWVRAIEPEPAPDAAELQRRERQRQADARRLSERAAALRAAAHRRPPRRTVSDSERAEQRCARARARADDRRDRLWNRLTFDQRRALDDDVARACKP